VLRDREVYGLGRRVGEGREVPPGTPTPTRPIAAWETALVNFLKGEKGMLGITRWMRQLGL
jgi:hypothetical protein